MRDTRRPDEGLSDGELVDRAREGDDAALGSLVERHHDAAFRLAVSILRDGDAARDAVQDAFIKAFRALGGFRGDAAFRTWVLSIVANEARGAWRKRSRRKESSIDLAAPVPTAGPDPEESALRSQEAARARRMLGELPEKQRLSVALRIDEGLSFREIGDIIGSSEGAARVNYFHGIRRLRELME